MQRLVEDAAKLDESIDANSLSFGNIVKAINAVQKEMGIYGTTAKEASATISGSLAAVKAQWNNLLTAISQGDDWDIGVYISNFIDTVKTALGNLLPVITKGLNGAALLIRDLIPTIVQEVPVLIEQNLPVLAEAAISIVNSLINGISENQEVIVSTALSVVTTLINGILGALPQLASVAMTLVATLATGLSENLDGLIPTVVSVIAEIANILTNLDNVRPITLAAIELILVLIEGIMEALPTLIDTILLVGENITATLLDPEILAKLVNAALRIIIALAGGIVASIPRLLTSVIDLVEAVIDNIVNADWGEAAKNVVDGLLDGLKKAWESVKSWFTNAWNNLFGNKSVNVSANVSGGDVDGSHAGGLDYVPFDGYVAELHKGEQVLTAEEAKDYKRGGKVVSVVQNIYSQAKTAADLMQEAKYQQERAVLFGV